MIILTLPTASITAALFCLCAVSISGRLNRANKTIHTAADNEASDRDTMRNLYPPA